MRAHRKIDLNGHWFGLFTQSVESAFFSTSHVKTVTAWLFICEWVLWNLNIAHHSYGIRPEWVRQAEPLPTLLILAEAIPLISAFIGLTYNSAPFMIPFITFQITLIGSIIGVVVDRVYVFRIMDVPPFCLFSFIAFLFYTAYTALKCHYYFKEISITHSPRRRDSIMANDMTLAAFGTPPRIEQKRGIDYASITPEAIFTDYGDEILV